MTKPKTVVLAGATGLVGGEVLRMLLADPAFARVTVLARRPLGRAGHAKLVELGVDFERLERHHAALEADAVISALGTTMRTAGSRAAFRRVDHDYPLALARLTLAEGSRHFLLVSALGASSHSSFFYLRVKGELEDALLGLGYPAITIVRLSLLLGERRAPRLGEEIAKRFGFLAPGRYRPVAAREVAAALVAAAREGGAGVRIIEPEAIRRLAARERAP